MKLLLLADKESPYFWDYYQPGRLREYDLMLSCGDLKAEYLSFLATLGRAPLYYVRGNHDGNYDRRPPEGCDCIEDKLIIFNGLDDYAHMGFEAFLPLLDRYKPRYLIHGHVHMEYGRDIARVLRRGDTTIINAYERYTLEV